ncbi:phosphate ABC transporter permease PstA [Acidisphaera rubrifaciens]|uniref:phosphate ABC transporter permease PstA n=1 Tax=Acidisphaera rubrifaciens TaxID=50715 RepID=UPI000662504E|nr:phosphate ABC transporter permease PstA [Acidisphaera rubrifaciens]
MATALFKSSRRAKGLLWTAGAALCAGGTAVILLLIMGYVVVQGIGALSWSFITHLPHPIGIPDGGVANGIVGTLIIVGIAAVIAFPIGILLGIYVGVYGHRHTANAIRFCADVLASVPSITIGVFAYALLVAPFKHFSAMSASFAFAILMVPLIVRTTEGAIRMVPIEMREAAVALGATDFQAMARCTLIAARPGIVTGLLLALARVTGETAPLLFTAFGSQFWELNPNNPMAELSLQIFTYAISPYREWHEQAWGGALILILAVFVLSLAARLALRRQPSANA